MPTDMSRRFDLKVNNGGDLAYICLPTHPGKGTIGASARQIDLMADYNIGKKVKIIVDIDAGDEIIGVEIILYD